ncbi:phosphate signaling complex PhoU family protein [Thermococcus barophilus]|uniref:Phosphate transport system regulator n=1 Tax=Thermococcus barophilus TaxID=55802 RepID=A0A0S1XEB2_THEBA|nr:phosphate uptake regulator PhoU [Thermococcus barophilus]ALM76097.1 Phosphate transport system regulator [Thermococcus barophilus]
MRKLLDMGIEHMKKLIGEMGRGALEALDSAKKSLDGEFDSTEEIASKLHIFRGEILEIATELLVRYSPVATDLRFIQSAIDVSYDLYRISRYAMEIERTMKIVQPKCQLELSREGFDATIKAVETAIDAFANLDEISAGRLLELDEKVDELYLEALKKLRNADECNAVDALILRHLERISDHAKEIGAKVVYIKEGRRL